MLWRKVQHKRRCSHQSAVQVKVIRSLWLNSGNHASDMLAFASGCTENKGLLTSRALRQASAGSKALVASAAVPRPLLGCQNCMVQLAAVQI